MTENEMKLTDALGTMREIMESYKAKCDELEAQLAEVRKHTAIEVVQFIKDISEEASPGKLWYVSAQDFDGVIDAIKEGRE